MLGFSIRRRFFVNPPPYARTLNMLKCFPPILVIAMATTMIPFSLAGCGQAQPVRTAPLSSSSASLTPQQKAINERRKENQNR